MLHRPPPDGPFWAALCVIAGLYLLLISGMLVADAAYALIHGEGLIAALTTPEARHATLLSLISCTIASILALWVAVPTGYLLSRTDFPGKSLIDAIVDIPIVLPPLVIGISLLILFASWPVRLIELYIPVTYALPGLVLAQFTVGAAFAVRAMRSSFDHLSPRTVAVAQTLGCSHAQAFFRIAVPEARRGMVTAFTVAWARSLGEFGPVLVFVGATRMKTEVLPTTVFLEFSVGHLDTAVAVSLLLVALALAVLVIIRRYGDR